MKVFYGGKLRVIKKYCNMIPVDGCCYSIVKYIKMIKLFNTIKVGDEVRNPYTGKQVKIKEVKKQLYPIYGTKYTLLDITLITEDNYIIYDYYDITHGSK